MTAPDGPATPRKKRSLIVRALDGYSTVDLGCSGLGCLGAATMGVAVVVAPMIFGGR